jgi:hypothetical protein
MKESQIQEQDTEIAREKRRARLFKEMMETEAWRLYEDLLNHHIGVRTQSVLDPTTPGGELPAEHNKGVAYGIIFCRDIPRVTVAAMKDTSASKPSEES